MFNTSEGHRKIAEAIQQMWKETLGLEVKLVNQEWKVYLTTIKGADTPQIYRLGWCLDYADANNFIYEVFALGGSANPSEDGETASGGIFWDKSDPLYEAFEAKMIDAAKELDPCQARRNVRRGRRNARLGKSRDGTDLLVHSCDPDQTVCDPHLGIRWPRTLRKVGRGHVRQVGTLRQALLYLQGGA